MRILLRKLLRKIVRVQLITDIGLEWRCHPFSRQIGPVEALKERVSLHLTGAIRAQPLAGHLVQQLQNKVLGMLGEEARHRRLRLENPLRNVHGYVLFTLDGEG